MGDVGGYIYCTRYSGLKSVLICALRCPYALGCKDWAGALMSDRRERIEQQVQAYALARGVVVNPEVWHPLQKKSKRLASPRRTRREARVAERSSSGSGVLLPSSGRCRSHSQSREDAPMGEEKPKRGEARRATTLSEVAGIASESPTRGRRASASVRRKRKAANPPGTIFLILERNGRYREVRSEEEMKRVAIESAGRNKKGLRFARATLLEVEVTFRPVR